MTAADPSCSTGEGLGPRMTQFHPFTQTSGVTEMHREKSNSRVTMIRGCAVNSDSLWHHGNSGRVCGKLTVRSLMATEEMLAVCPVS